MAEIEKDYEALAREAIAAEAAARAEGELQSRVASMRFADEREAQLTALRAKHGLPDTTTLRQMADAEIAHGHAWRDFVAHAHPGHREGFPAVEILSPQSVVDDDARRQRAEDVQQRLRTKFEAAYDAQVASRSVSATTDGLSHSYGHNIGAAA
jgi:ParB-like chromosome segregation protein Spo0J